MDGTPFGRCRLIELLDRGGIGEVAFDTDTDRIVAIKVLPEHLAQDDTFVHGFHRGALLVARLDALTAATRLAGARAARARELADQISDALGHLHRLVRVLDDNELDELASGG